MTLSMPMTSDITPKAGSMKEIIDRLDSLKLKPSAL